MDAMHQEQLAPTAVLSIVVSPFHRGRRFLSCNNNNNDRLTAFDPGQPG